MKETQGCPTSTKDTLLNAPNTATPRRLPPLVTTYQPPPNSRLYTHILGRIKDTETAKNLTQETWIKAFRAINTFRADASLASFL